MKEKVHLAIISTDTDSQIQIEGETMSVFLAWMQLSAAVAEAMHLPLSALLENCIALGGAVEDLNRRTEAWRIDLSRPVKPTHPNDPA